MLVVVFLGDSVGVGGGLFLLGLVLFVRRVVCVAVLNTLVSYGNLGVYSRRETYL